MGLMNYNSSDGFTDTSNNHTHGHAEEAFSGNFSIHVGVAIGTAIFICIVIIIVIVLYNRGTFCRFRSGDRRLSTRRLFIRGFSTVSQRGVIDSTAEFEIVNTTSVSSHDRDEQLPEGAVNPNSGTPPKKPQRLRTRTSSSNVKYENVALDANAGFVIRKSASMNSEIPYIDTTLESRLSEHEEELDDVFH